MKLKLAAATFCILSAGCSSYSETGIGSMLDDAVIGKFGISRSGVTDTPLAEDAYRIRGYGNQNASFEKTNAVAMVRAAVLASEHGYDRFKILDFNTWEKSSFHSTPATANTTTTIHANAYGSYVSGHATSTTTITPGQTYTLDRPRTDIVVQFVRNDSPEAESALRVAGIISRYGKKAGLTSEEMQAAMNVAPAQVALAPSSQLVTESALVSAPIPAKSATLASTMFQQDGPTLDEIYKALSPSQKAHINSLPLARRADFLMMIRDRQY